MAGSDALRIGEVAKLTGTTPRTIRYYEEIGVLPAAAGRPAGSHRVYDADDVERLQEVLRLKDLLGLSLDELAEVATAETARAGLRREWNEEEPDPDRRRQILDEARGHVDRQLELVRRRNRDLESLERELVASRRRIERRRRELDEIAPTPGD
jgi:MerR family transcriptional regulator, repressor of the yfmOP operon